MTDRADLVVVGAGTVGGWASVFAAAAGVGRVVVLERGFAGDGASSRAAGIVRPGRDAGDRRARTLVDRLLSRAGGDLRHRSGFRELGYLILAVTDEDERLGRERVAMQHGAGADGRPLAGRRRGGRGGRHALAGWSPGWQLP